MSNKEEMKNEAGVLQNDAKKEKDVAKNPVGGIETADAFAWRDEAESVENNGQETVFSDTGVKLQRELRPGGDGRTYQNFALAFFVEVKGKKIMQTAYFNPPAQNGAMYELLDAIFGSEMYCPVDIVKTVSTVNNGNRRTQRVSYSLRVSAENDLGGKISCDMSPSKRGDTVAFLNLIEMLKARDMIK